MPIKNEFVEMHDEIICWRRDFHQHPELLFETQRTSGLVAERLRNFGVDEVVTGLGRTGVVGVIKGKSTSSGKVIGLRADMDALPIQEATGLDYASKVKGSMHACGHDGHTAMLLGASKYLAETRQFNGTVIVIFQPAEERGGGAREMCEDGLIDRFGIQEVYGMHNWPELPIGQFAIRSGPFFAASDGFDVEIHGRGGHAAKPHETIDSTLVASYLIVALQSISSRNANPIDQVVVSVTSFETSSNAYNVIPEKVTLRGTVRTLTTDMRELVEKRFLEIAEGTAQAFGAKAKVSYTHGYPVMVNSEEQTDFASSIARSVSSSCSYSDLVMGGEDFAYMLNEVPGAYILLGNGNSAPVHNERYNFNDEAIPTGCSWFAEVAENRMQLLSR